MSTKDDIKEIADMHSKEKVELRVKVDSMLAKIYKEIYSLAYQGKYSLRYPFAKDESKVFVEIVKILKSEKFKVFHTQVATDDSFGELYIAWDK